MVVFAHSEGNSRQLDAQRQIIAAMAVKAVDLAQWAASTAPPPINLSGMCKPLHFASVISCFQPSPFGRLWFSMPLDRLSSLIALEQGV